MPNPITGTVPYRYDLSYTLLDPGSTETVIINEIITTTTWVLNRHNQHTHPPKVRSRINPLFPPWPWSPSNTTRKPFQAKAKPQQAFKRPFPKSLISATPDYRPILTILSFPTSPHPFNFSQPHLSPAVPIQPANTCLEYSELQLCLSFYPITRVNNRPCS